MRTRPIRTGSMFSLLALAMATSSPVLAQARKQERLNPVIGLLEEKKAVMGLYAPTHGGPGATAQPQKSPVELARETVAQKLSDYVFDGSMEYDFDAAFPAFAEFAGALKNAGATSRTQPMITKIPMIAPDPKQAASYISRQLDVGVSGVMFVGVESADELGQGIAAMRFESDGGTRPDSVGSAPKYWGMSEQEYRRKADVWPLDSQGELITWAVIETRKGLENVREIAAVKGLGVLWAGAGTLRGVFSSTGPDGKKVFDQAGWEAAIQRVLAACKEFKVACGFPAGPDNIEMRMKQGFSVFVVPWSDAGFKALQVGRKAANRPLSGE